MTNQSFKRQLVTIMSVDVVSYSRLMGENEGNTLIQLNKHRKTVEKSVTSFGGRMFGVAGDSQMAEFSSPIDAVRSAVEFQSAIHEGNKLLNTDQRMTLRVGLNVGDVIVENGDLFGDDVNIAARLQESARPGGVAISHTVLSHIDDPADLNVTDAGYQNFKNINIPIHLFHIQIGDETEGMGNSLAGILSVPAELSPVPGFANRPALAVLPFSDQGSSKDSRYIAEGLSEDIAIGLAKMRWFPVISKNSSFVFNGKPVDEMTIGRTLGARYLLEGNVRLHGELLRVSAQLVNAEKGINVWSQTYQYQLKDIFELQDEIAQNIISALSTQIDMAEQSRAHAKSPESLDVWDLVKRGLWHQNKLTGKDSAIAFDYFEKALEKEPNSVEALVQMSLWNFWHVWAARKDDGNLIEMERLARLAMHIDRMDARPHMLVGISLLMRRKADRARVSLGEAVRLNPGLSTAHASIGSTYILSGNGELAIPPLKTAIRLNPDDMFCFHTLGELAFAHMMIGQRDACIEYSDQSLKLRPGYWYARLARIIALVEAEAMEDARKEVVELKQQNPDLGIDDIRWLPFVDPAWNDHLVEKLTLVGF